MSASNLGSTDDVQKHECAYTFAGVPGGDKKAVTVVHQFACDPKTRAVGERKKLVVGGAEVKSGDPLVFLVDLTGEKVTCTSVKTELPSAIPRLVDDKGTPLISEPDGKELMRAVGQLKAASAEVKAFLDPAPKK